MSLDPTKLFNMGNNVLAETKAAVNKHKCGNAMLGIGISFTLLAVIAAVAIPLLMSFAFIPAVFAMPIFIGIAVLAATGLSLLIAGAICRHQAKQQLINKFSNLSGLGSFNV